MTPPAAQRAGTKNRPRAVASRLASLFDEHASMVLGLCRLLLRDHHEAEDAAQQTFVSAYRSLLRGTEPRDAAPWLAAIARNECRARIRKRMRAPLALENELEEQLADPTDIVDESERRAELAALTAAIAQLPSRQREAVALRDFLGLSYEEVASTLSVSVPVVESLLFRARRRLRDTVRTVPRYAAGLVAIPLALRAAVSRELPDLDSHGTAGAAGMVGGTVAGVIAKIVSLPFAGKAATAVSVLAVATAGPQVPHFFDGDTGTSRSAVSALHDSSSTASATEQPASKPPFEARSEPASPEPAASDAAPVVAATTGGAPGAPAEADTDVEEPPASEDSPAEPIEPVREVYGAASGPGASGQPLVPVATLPEAPSQAPPAADPATAPPVTDPATTLDPSAVPPPLLGDEPPEGEGPVLPPPDGSGDGAEGEEPPAEPELPPTPPAESPPAESPPAESPPATTPTDESPAEAPAPGGSGCDDPVDEIAPAGDEPVLDPLADAEAQAGRGHQCPLDTVDGR
jgi:RNA polymerase sigma-70 factor (ECF subfamily)